MQRLRKAESDGIAQQTILLELSDFAAGLSLDVLPPDVVELAKLCILDTLSSCLTINGAPKAQAALRSIAINSTKGPATIYGTPHSASAADAAFVNAVSAACPSRSDTLPGPASHPGLVIVPTVLALAEAYGRSGRSVIEGVVLGYEIMARLGRVMVTPEIAEIFRPTGITGPTAAAIAGAKTLGLSVERTVSAGSLGSHTASGFNEWAHTQTGENVFHAGFCARNSITAVLLAEAGILSAPSIIEGPAGLLAGYGARDRASRITQDLGKSYEMMELIFKGAPACIFIQTPCQLAESVARKNGIAAADIESVEVSVVQAAAQYPGCDNKGPISDHQGAKNSIQFSVASVFCKGGVRDSNWLDFHSVEANELASRITVSVDAGMTAQFPAKQGARLTVRLRNGNRVDEIQNDLLPMTKEQIIARYLDTAIPLLGQAQSERIVAQVDQMEKVADVGALLLLTQPRPQ